VAVAALGLAAGGCGESREEARSTSTSAPPAPTTPAPATNAEFTVTEREYSLSPSDLRVPKAGTFSLVVRNTGAIPHALEVEGPAGELKTGAIAPGKTARLEVALRKPGRYEWYCPIGDHRKRGMRGTVVVGKKG
jgi:plastocyanin